MSIAKIIGIILILLGAVGLAMGGFSYTKETHEAKIGPLQLSVQEKKDVDVPIWASLAAIAVGVVLLVVPGKGK
jgi:hypothetical protein